MNRRMKMLLAATAALLLLVMMFSMRSVTRMKQAALGAEQDFNECQELAAKLQAIGSKPRLAAQHEQVVDELTGALEKAARSAGVMPDSIATISPQPARRLGDTVYKEKPTQVLLRKITLKQLSEMAYSLLSGNTGLHVRSIRLSAPRHDDTGGLWTAELVVTYMLYDPPRMER